MHRFIILIFVIGFNFIFYSCENGEPIAPPAEPPSLPRPVNLAEYNVLPYGLKDYFTEAGFFEIGAAIEPSSLNNPAHVRILQRHMSSITAENVMKWQTIQPSEGVWRWDLADSIVNFGQRNGMKVRGHTLVWHNQLPSWVTVDRNGSPVSKEILLQRIRDHVTTVVSRYRGRVYAWDVVNEVIDNGSGMFRPSPLYTIAGDDFIFEAFRAARAADPSALLFYNDYRETDPVKRDKILNLLRRLKAENLVDGMGMQGHWNMVYPSNDRIIDAIQRYHDIGLDIHITELDISVYNNDSDPQRSYDAILASQLRAAYVRYFNIFRFHKDKISNVTFWGVTDAGSWLNNWPVPGRMNYPLLFDRNNNPKEAYFGVINF